jgi:hypothetical protein
LSAKYSFHEIPGVKQSLLSNAHPIRVLQTAPNL